MTGSEAQLLDQTYLRIAGAVSESIVDGPGIRYAVFTQGCPFRCPGCHNQQTWDPKGGLSVPLRMLYDEIIKNPLISGVTFSGGEPFVQPEPLCTFAKILRRHGYSLWSYTGFTFEHLIEDPARLNLARELDVIVDGPFMLKQKSLLLDFRGSSNQRIIDVKASLAAGKVILMPGFN